LVVSNFWDLMWLILSTFVFVAYLLILFQIVADLFRDSELGGGSKALWLIGLIFVPMLTALVYVITRGTGMANRQRAAIERSKSEAESYIRQVAGKSPAEQIADAKALLDAGTITQDEFAKLKAKALG
jgi:Short C-terminal domain